MHARLDGAVDEVAGVARARWPRLRRTARRLAIVGMALGALAAAPRRAAADTWSDASSKLDAFDKELPALAAITAPDKASLKADTSVSRLIEAQVAFGVGDYDTSSVLLYEVVSKNAATPGATGVDVGVYYLAESLYQQGDLAAARTYFARVVDEIGAASRYYQAALERLVELAILLDEHEGIEARLTALGQVAAAGGRPSATYVRGKYAASRGQHDDALALLAQVPAGSTYDFQAQYVTGTVYVAKGDLPRAIEAFTALAARKPSRAADRRVIELSFMALGRLNYERDLPAKAIDSYLEIDRKSDLFADALYEVAWVYVKGKQFDKALRALELLALTDPNSTKLPTVKILEGNLRIRKAQLLRSRQIEGMVSAEGTPAEEYDRARTVFGNTHDTYKEPLDAITAVLAGTGCLDSERGGLVKPPAPPPELAPIDPAAPAPVDPAASADATATGAVPAAAPVCIVASPADFLDQLSGRNSKAFSIDAELPSIGAAWLREDAEVARVIDVESDLGDIQDSIEESESTIERLELSMSLANKVKLFPELGKKRARATDMQAALLAMQLAVVEEEVTLAPAGGNDPALAALTTARKLAVAELANLPTAEKAFAERVARVRGSYDTLEGTASQVQVALDGLEAARAELQAALADPATGVFQRAQLTQGLAEVDADIGPMRAELTALRADIALGRDEAAARDEFALYAKATRQKARQAIAAEHAALKAALGAGANPAFDRTMTRANVLEDKLEALNKRLDDTAEAALVDVRAEVAANKTELAATRAEFLQLEAESRAIGGEVVARAMVGTQDDLDDVLVRADVGKVDVAWSQKEDVDADLKSFTLSKQRGLKQLYIEFKDILDEEKALKAAAAAAATPTPTPPTDAPPTPPASTPAPTTGGTP